MTIEVLETRQDESEKRVDRVEEDISRDIAGIYKKLEKLADRPSWPVVTLITLLSSFLAVCLGKGLF